MRLPISTIFYESLFFSKSFKSFSSPKGHYFDQLGLYFAVSYSTTYHYPKALL